MLRTRTDVWCWALLGSLGLLPGCGGQSASHEAEAGGAGGGPSPTPGGGMLQSVGGRAVVNGGSTSGGTSGGTTSAPKGGAGAQPNGGTGAQPNGGTGAQPNGGAGAQPNGGTAGESMQSACKGSTPIVEGGVESGLWRCADGVVHRPAPVKCESNLPRPAVPLPADAPYGECASDADCTEKPYGYCGPFGSLARTCQYGCASDADCGAGNLCVCGPEFGMCATAKCQSDQDCAGDLKCAAWTPFYGFGCGERPAYACQSPEDTCKTDADCGQGTYYCAVVSGVRACKPITGPACGRPFLVQGQERLACAETSAAWRGKLDASPALTELSSSQRERLGAEWTKIALMEHASVAAFARFALQLLHVGAPRELLLACQQAMADETEHARLCFELASVYLDRDVGPGVLPMDAALEGTNLESIVRLVVREGCIGETIAAQEAAEAAACAQDAAVLSVLERIQQDERAHAELAWRFVAWALKRDGKGVRDVVADELSLVARELQVEAEAQHDAGPQTDELALAQHGVLPAHTRAEVRRAVLSDIVLPCGQQLLAQTAPAAVRERSLTA